MNRKLAISLALMFSLGITGTAFAAEPDMAAELASLKARMLELEKSMATAKVAKKKDQENKLSFDGSDFRLRWIKDGADSGDSAFMERVRLNMNYKVNDDITFNARWRLENENELGTTGLAGKDGYMISDANMAIKNILGSTMTMGRFSQPFGATTYWNSAALGLIDGVKFDTKIAGVKVATGYANFGAYTNPTTTYTTKYVSGSGTSAVYKTTATTTFSPKLEDALFLNASYGLSKATTVNAMWVKETTGDDSNFDVRGLGMSTQIADDWKVVGDYTKNYAQTNNPSGYYVSLRWKDAKDDTPGSYGLRLDYRDIKNGNMFSTSGTGVSVPTQGYKGPAVAAQYCLANKVMLDAFQTFNTKDAGTGIDLPNYTRVQVTVGF